MMELVSGKVVQSCPNAGNPFHECTAICFEILNSGNVHKKEKKLFGTYEFFFNYYLLLGQKAIIKELYLMKHANFCQGLVRELQAETLHRQAVPLVEADRLLPAILPRRRLNQRLHLPLITPMVTSSAACPHSRDARPSSRTSLQTIWTRSLCLLPWKDTQGETILQGG